MVNVCQGCGGPLPPSRGPVPRKWCSERCRKQTSYSRPCVDCGAPLNGSDSRGVHSRCCRCAAAVRRIWTRDSVIAAIHRWSDLYGQPPAAGDWNLSLARSRGWDIAVRRFRDGRWPCSSTVCEVFGSWNAAIAAAGFEPRRVGQRGPDRHRRGAVVA